jgi:membrane-bound serine protease (ClpP class)
MTANAVAAAAPGFTARRSSVTGGLGRAHDQRQSVDLLDGHRRADCDRIAVGGAGPPQRPLDVDLPDRVDRYADAGDGAAELLLAGPDVEPAGGDHALTDEQQAAAEDIVDQIRTAPMPVVVYVFPGGAEVENRGAAIVDAADVAAMAPGTTLESEGNDLGENTALKQGRIDTIAADQETLLGKLDGWEVAGPKEETLSVAGEEIDDRSTTIPFEVLGVLVNPDVAVLLIFVGLLGLALEAFAPGTIIPGTLGAVALILGVIGAVQLPVAAIGVVLLVAAFGLILAATRMRPAAALGAFGVAALIGGGLLLFDTDSDQIAVSPAFVIVAGATLGLATILVGDRVLGARRRPGIESGPEGAA